MKNKETQSHAIVTGGFSPYTKAHHAVVQQMQKDGHSSVNVFATESGRRPIPPQKKVDYIKTAVGEGVNVGTTVTPFHALSKMYSDGKRGKVVVYGGSDRAPLADRLRNYNGEEGKHGYYKFDSIEFRQVGGERKEGAKGMAGVSGTAARAAKSPKELKKFIPTELHDRADEIFKDLKEEVMTPLAIFLLGSPGSGKDYVLNNIFSRFDLTEVQVEHLLNGAADELLEQNKNIVINGAIDAQKINQVSELLEGYAIDNVYVSVSNKVSRLRNSLRENPLAENKRIEKWLKAEKLAETLDEKFTFNNSINLKESTEFERVFFADQIEKLLARLIEHGLVMKEEPKPQTFTLIREKKFPPVKHKYGMPAKYSAGLSKATALARKRHWAKTSKMSDSDPASYEPAPGDKTAKTKPSKHTLAVRKMMGEQIEGTLKVPHTVESIAEKHGVSQAEIIQALAMGKKVEMEHTKDEKTAETIALAHLDEKPDYYTQLAKMEQFTGDDQSQYANYGGAEQSRKLRRARTVDHFRRVHQYEREAHKVALTKEEAESIEEAAADKSLAAKAAKSGVSLSTLRKVYRRGVAAWNSGHRPGTTPSQWGHARVNSYINKGKTYHTADKDLREEEELDDINVLFERQLLGTDEYRIHAIAMTPGQNQEIENAYEVLAKDRDEEDCCCGGEEYSDEEATNATSNPRNFRELRSAIKEASKEVVLPPTADVTPTLKKGKGSNRITTPSRLVNPSIDGLPVTSRLTGEEVELAEGDVVPFKNKQTEIPTNRFARKQNEIEVERKAAEGQKNIRTIDQLRKDAADALDPRSRAQKAADAAKAGVGKVTSAVSKVIPEPVKQTASAVGSAASKVGSALKTVAGTPVGRAAIKYSNVAGMYNLAKNVAAADTPEAAAERQKRLDDMEARRQQLTKGMDFAGDRGVPAATTHSMVTSLVHGTEAGKQWKASRDVPDPWSVALAPVVPGMDAGEEWKKLKSDTSYWWNKAKEKLTGKKTNEEVELIEEAVMYHLSENISLTQNAFRPGSEMFFEMINIAKELYKEGHYTPTDEYEKDLLDSDVGEYAAYEGSMVPLDFPFEDSLTEEDATNGKGVGKPWREGSGGAVYVRDGDSIRKIRFSQSGMQKKYMDPGRVRSFVARHHCLTNKDKTSASYWACRWPRFFSNSGKIWW